MRLLYSLPRARARILGLLSAFLFPVLFFTASPTCRADDTFGLTDGGTVVDTNWHNFFPPNPNNVFVGAYNVTINGSATTAMCISIDRDSTPGTAWDAKAYNLGGDLTGLWHSTTLSFDTFRQIAFLYQELSLFDTLTQQSKIIAYQKAAWTLAYKPGEQNPPTGYSNYLLDPNTQTAVNAALTAAANYGGYNSAFDQKFVFYQPTGFKPDGMTRNQVFITQIPEPSPVAYLAGAFVLFGAVQVVRSQLGRKGQIGPRYRNSRLSDLTQRIGEA